MSLKNLRTHNDLRAPHHSGTSVTEDAFCIEGLAGNFSCDSQSRLPRRARDRRSASAGPHPAGARTGPAVPTPRRGEPTAASVGDAASGRPRCRCPASSGPREAVGRPAPPVRPVQRPRGRSRAAGPASRCAPGRASGGRRCPSGFRYGTSNFLHASYTRARAPGPSGPVRLDSSSTFHRQIRRARSSRLPASTRIGTEKAGNDFETMVCPACPSAARPRRARASSRQATAASRPRARPRADTSWRAVAR